MITSPQSDQIDTRPVPREKITDFRRLVRLRQCACIALASFAPGVPLVSASAQETTCPQWIGGLFPHPGIDGETRALIAFDDGSGRVLFAAGSFTRAENSSVRFVARWDGTNWSTVGPGFDSTVDTLAIFDDGSGPSLYAGGGFEQSGETPVHHVARWNGSSWLPLGEGTDYDVLTLASFNDGTGTALYAAGLFSAAGGSPASQIAKWDGHSWSALGAGLSGGDPIHHSVSALAAFDDGSGAALYAGGNFDSAGGQPVSNIARWNGSTWSSVGAGANGSVSALFAFDDGGGEALYAGGGFSAPGKNVARWDGTSWHALGSGTNASVRALAAFDDGSGRALIAGGSFSQAGGVAASAVARWDGRAWSTLGTGLSRGVDGSTHASCLLAARDGAGPVLFVGGDFTRAGSSSGYFIAGWRADQWFGLGNGLDGPVDALAEFDGGDGLSIYAGGSFTRAGDIAAGNVARFDGSGWTPLGAGLDGPVEAVAAFDDGSGPALYAAGAFQGSGGTPLGPAARWDGSGWSTLGIVSDVIEIQTLAVFDDGSGSALYAGGIFRELNGVTFNSIARWNGSSWSPLGSGLEKGFALTTVSALFVFDDGAGPALFVGGDFDTAGGMPARDIAKWQAGSWSAIGPGIAAPVRAMEAYDSGSGRALYAGGDSYRSLFRLEAGGAWTRLTGFDGTIDALAVYDEGSGAALYAAGELINSSAQLVGIERWDGAAFSPVESGLYGGHYDHKPHALLAVDDGTKMALYAGGDFTEAAGSVSAFMAKRTGVSAGCRLGNVNTRGGGAAVDVLFVNGSAGDPGCRRVSVARRTPVTISLSIPPHGGPGHYALWIYDGEPGPGEEARILYKPATGVVYDLGLGCRALPSNNLFAPGSVPCPVMFPHGRTSRRLGTSAASRLCLDSGPGSSRAPTSFMQVFPFGMFTVCGLMADPGSPNAKPISIMNWVLVDSR